MENQRLWTRVRVSWRLMVSDFRNLHCEGSASASADAEEIRPGYKFPGTPDYGWSVTVKSLSDEWIEFQVGEKSVVVMSGQSADGPEYPLSYAYGEVSISVDGACTQAGEIVEKMRHVKTREENAALFRQLVAMAVRDDDAWAAYLAAQKLVNTVFLSGDLPVDELASINKAICGIICDALVGGCVLDSVREKAWYYLCALSCQFIYAAPQMRIAAQSIMNKPRISCDDALKALQAATYSGDSALIEKAEGVFIECKGNPARARLFALSRAMADGKPYMPELLQMMAEGVWEAHYMYILHFLPQPMGISSLAPTAEQEAQIETSLAFLADAYARLERENSKLIDAINLVNYYKYCATGGKEGAGADAKELYDKGYCRGLPFSMAIYGIVLSDTYNGPKELSLAMKCLEGAARSGYLPPMRAYLAGLDKEGGSERMRQLVANALAPGAYNYRGA